MSGHHERPDGVYFGLPDSEYHAEPRLSASAMKWLRVSPRDFWVRSWLCPERAEDEDTTARILGIAYHRRILEGSEPFSRDYAVMPERSDYPDAIQGNDALKVACKERDLPVSGTKSALIKRLMEREPTIQIWEDILSRYIAGHPGKTLLPAKDMKRVEIAAALIEKHPDLGKCVRGGYPEVSIYWHDEETGVACKSRIDYLKPRAIVDLKSVGNALGKPFDVAVRSAIANYGYFVQGAMYYRAIEVAASFARKGQAFGNVDRVFLETFSGVNSGDRRFIFLAQDTGPAQVARGYVFPRGTVYTIGNSIVEDCLKTFAECSKTFGDGPWIDTAPITELDDLAFPSWIGQDL